MSVVALALVGGFLALDATSVGQFMLSRPIVVGALVGWAVGDPLLGLGVGAVLELYLIVSVPSGGARFPEGATATVVAVAVASSLQGAGALPLSVGFGLLWGQVGGMSVTGLRHLNARFAPEPEDGPIPPGLIVSVHLGGIALDLARATVVTLFGIVCGRWAMGLMVEAWPLGFDDSLGMLLVGGFVSAGILLRDLGGFRRRRWAFIMGLVAGLVGAGLL